MVEFIMHQLTSSQVREEYPENIWRNCHLRITTHEKSSDMKWLGELACVNQQRIASLVATKLSCDASTGWPLKNKSTMEFFCASRTYGGLEKRRFFFRIYAEGQWLLLVLEPESGKALLYCVPPASMKRNCPHFCG